MNPRLKDTIVRAAKTFVQAFLATLAVSVAGVNDVDTAVAAIVAAASAAASLVWNSLSHPALPATAPLDPKWDDPDA
jgi:hypothetical protein